MPITVFPASHGAELIQRSFLNSTWTALNNLVPALEPHSAEVLQSSFSPETFPPSMLSSTNGLVYSLVNSYSNHHHLRVRPDDIWIAIVTQISIYILAHAEELRHIFVPHQGQKHLAVQASGTRYTVDLGGMAQAMTKAIEKNILDPSWREWIIPDFSTTTRQDDIVASVLMMSTMQKYFTYEFMITCGIPSITLLGEKSDYERILARLDKLESLGDEPAQFANRLRPVLRRMIYTFDNPSDQSVIDFWQRVLDVHNLGSGSNIYTGWIAAFCFWDKDGKMLGYLDSDEKYSENGTYGATVEKTSWGELKHYKELRLSLDGIRYPTISSDKIPPAWGEVPVLIVDNGEEVKSVMVAGLVGIKCEESGDVYEDGKTGLDTMQPQTGWWIYGKKATPREQKDEL